MVAVAIPLQTGPQDPSQLDNVINQVVTSLNTTGVPVIQSGVVITDAIQNGNATLTPSFTTTSNTAYAILTGLSVTLTAGGTYNVRAHLNGSAGASGGIKVETSGAATYSSANFTMWNYNGSTINAVTNVTSTSNAVLMAQSAAFTDLVLEGGIVVATGGSFQLWAAQNASSTTALTVSSQSSMTVSRVS